MWTNWSASVINVHYAKMQHQNKSIIGIFIIIVKINQHVWKSSKNANISLMLINLPTHNDGIMRSSPNHKVNSLYYRSSFFTWHWIIIFVFLADPEVLNPLWWIIFDLVQLDRDYLVEITVPGSSTEVFSVWGSNYCFPLPEPENFWSQWFFYHKQVWITSTIPIHGKLRWQTNDDDHDSMWFLLADTLRIPLVPLHLIVFWHISALAWSSHRPNYWSPQILIVFRIRSSARY